MEGIVHFVKKKFFFLLCGLAILISFVIAFISASSQIGFYFDQARDAYFAYSIWHGHHLKILGPPSDVPGLYHGVLWYYLLAVIYFLGRNNPITAVGLLTFFLYFSIPFCGYVAYLITKNKKISFLSMALYSGAPLLISFSHWLSNPVIAVFISPILLYLLWEYIEKPSFWYACFLGFFFGIMVQSDFAFLPLVLIAPLYLYVFRLKLKFKDSLGFIASFLISTSTFFIASIKFHSNLISIIFQRFFANGNLETSVTSAVLSFVDSIVQFLSITYVCMPVIIAAVFIIWIFIRLRKSNIDYKNKQHIFLFVWTLSIVVLFALNHGDVNNIFFFAPIIFSTSVIIASFLISAFPQAISLTAVFLILFCLQVFRNGINFYQKSSYLVIQPGMVYSDETKIIDYTYQAAKGKPFTINAVTNPLYVATTWSYLYEFYGKNKYGYMPYWGGRSQVGQINSLDEIKVSTSLRFLIYEPTSIIPPIWVTKIVYDENKISDVISQKQIGQFTIEERNYDPTKKPPEIPEVLLKHKAVLYF